MGLSIIKKTQLILNMHLSAFSFFKALHHYFIASIIYNEVNRVGMMAAGLLQHLQEDRITQSFSHFLMMFHLAARYPDPRSLLCKLPWVVDLFYMGAEVYDQYIPNFLSIPPISTSLPYINDPTFKMLITYMPILYILAQTANNYSKIKLEYERRQPDAGVSNTGSAHSRFYFFAVSTISKPKIGIVAAALMSFLLVCYYNRDFLAHFILNLGASTQNISKSNLTFAHTIMR